MYRIYITDVPGTRYIGDSGGDGKDAKESRTSVLPTIGENDGRSEADAAKAQAKRLQEIRVQYGADSDEYRAAM